MKQMNGYSPERPADGDGIASVVSGGCLEVGGDLTSATPDFHYFSNGTERDRMGHLVSGLVPSVHEGPRDAQERHE